MIQNRIKEIREYFGLTQAQFALRIKTSAGFVSLAETGRKNVSKEIIKRICTVFSVNESWLVNGEGEMTDAAPVDRKNIGQRISQIRKGKKLKQDEFAVAIGYSKQHISYIETGRLNPSNELIQKISSVFGVNIDWLMTGKGEQYSDCVDQLDEELIAWINNHPEVVRELRVRSKLE